MSQNAPASDQAGPVPRFPARLTGPEARAMLPGLVRGWVVATLILVAGALLVIAAQGLPMASFWHAALVIVGLSTVATLRLFLAALTPLNHRRSR